MIKINMDMPKSCSECLFYYGIYYTSAHCLLTHELFEIDSKRRLKTCPLQPCQSSSDKMRINSDSFYHYDKRYKNTH